mgnify:CR=1 FL=1
MYVAGNYYRGNYKKPQWGLQEPSPAGAWGKLEQAAPYLGAAGGFAKTVYDNWDVLRPIVAGARSVL